MDALRHFGPDLADDGRLACTGRRRRNVFAGDVSPETASAAAAGPALPLVDNVVVRADMAGGPLRVTGREHSRSTWKALSRCRCPT